MTNTSERKVFYGFDKALPGGDYNALSIRSGNKASMFTGQDAELILALIEEEKAAIAGGVQQGEMDKAPKVILEPLSEGNSTKCIISLINHLKAFPGLNCDTEDVMKWMAESMRICVPIERALTPPNVSEAAEK